MPEQFFSEDGCDAWLAQSGLLPDEGVYVDAGCAHPWRYSQTAFLRNRGWTGLAIDGNPAYAPEWEGVANAQFVQAVLSDKPTARFLLEPTNSLVSRVHEIGQETPAKSLLEIIMTIGLPFYPHFIAVDIEGMEVEAIYPYLLNTPRGLLPKILVVEYNSCHKGRDPRVFNLLGQFPYQLVHLTDSNAIFARP